MTTPHLEYRPRWTAADLQEIPGEFRAEIFHGALIVNPAPRKRHQLLIHRLMDQLEPQLPSGWTLAFDFDIMLAEDHTRRPDLGVVPESSMDVDPTPASDLAVVVEVVSPGSEMADRKEKPEEYAAAGIGAYWRIETRGALALISYELVGDHYLEHSPTTNVFEASQPWSMRIDIPDLGRISSQRLPH